MSNPRLLMVFCGVGIVLLLVFGPGTEPPEMPADEGTSAMAGASAERGPVPVVEMPSDWAQQEDRQRQETIAREQIRSLRAAYEARQLREESGRQTEFQWEQRHMSSEWKLKRLVDTNLGLFELMKIEARNEDDREVRCRICDGDTKLDVCIICDSKGTCPACLGSGRERNGPERPCTTCEGRKTCFHCVGKKKMNCLFCEKGRITSVTPWPRYELELP